MIDKFESDASLPLLPCIILWDTLSRQALMNKMEKKSKEEKLGLTMNSSLAS